MTNEQKYLLNCIRCYLNDEQVDEFDGSWEEVIRLAQIHGVIGILGHMAYKVAPAEIASFLRSQAMQTVITFSQRGELMKRLIVKMNEDEIDHLLFKGYIVKEYYPVPELRTYGDIDFLIREPDRKHSDEMFRSLDFECKTDWEPVYSYVRGPEYYEVHTAVLEIDVSDKADFVGYFSEVWRHARCVSEHTYELEPEFHLIYMLTHIAKHVRGSGAGIRMYMDIGAFIRHFGDSVDWKLVEAELSKISLSSFANMVFTVVEKYLGVESPIALKDIPDDIFEMFMDRTMSGGMFGYADFDAGVNTLKNRVSEDGDISRGGTIVKRLFPPADEIEIRYTYLQGRHWLLPVAWVHRLFKTRDKWKKHSEEAKSIMNADSDEVNRLKRLQNEIGL